MATMAVSTTSVTKMLLVSYYLLAAGSHAFLPTQVPSTFPSKSSSLWYSLGQQQDNQSFDVHGAVAAVQEETRQLSRTILEAKALQQQQDASALMKVVTPNFWEEKSSTVPKIILTLLDQILQEWSCEETLIRLIQAGDDSVRFINARRFEVFVDSPNKGTKAFEYVATRVADAYNNNIHHHHHHNNDNAVMTATTVKEIFLAFARQQADQADPRHVQHDFHYHNFAILINYGTNCPQQVPHIDLVLPNAQFGLMISNQVPGTIWYDPVTPIQTPRDLQKAWQKEHDNNDNNNNNNDNNANNANSNNDNDIDDHWVSVMEQDSTCCYRLRRYGNVLSPQLVKYETPLLHTGTLLSLPGGVVHAGPSCPTFRAVLFFSGYLNHPNGEVAPYNPDVQYFDSVMLSDMIAKLWTQLTVSNRRYLLQRLVEYLARAPYDNRCMYKHLPAGCSMREFAEHLETQVLSTSSMDEHQDEQVIQTILADTELQQYIRGFANQEYLIYIR